MKNTDEEYFFDEEYKPSKKNLYSLTDVMDESRATFKAMYGRLLTEKEAVELTEYVRDYLKRNKKS